MGDQTFHTPSFGDEEFDIPQMHHQQQMHQQHMDQYQPPPQQYGNGGIHLKHSGAFSNTLEHSRDEQQYNQWHQEQPHMNAYPMQSPNQVPYHQIPSPNHNPQLQMMQPPPPQPSPQMPPQMSPQIGMSGVNYVGQSPPQSGHNISTETGTTSDDSDDAIPANTLKRPSPEPAYGGESPNNTNIAAQKSTPSAALSKKPKVQKKKKKRDPNEPQKPVSAYALFFRDTQAAIKGQNPNASFGEVSKIVASMWDVLATEHKNVYKKKTEAAKKEYLKALAAYRASLVSKGTEGEQQQSQQQSQQMYSPPQTQQQQQQQSPPQISPHHHMQNYQQPPYVPPYKSPQNMMQMQHPHMSNQMSPMNQMNQAPQMMSPPMNQNMNGMMGGMGGNNQQHYMNQQMPSQQQQQQQSPQQHHQMPGGHISPAQQPPVSGSPPNHQGQGQCIRHGCNNPAVVSPDWEDEYCSNECVITHCRDVFGNWVQTNNPQQQSYSAVK